MSYLTKFRKSLRSILFDEDDDGSEYKKKTFQKFENEEEVLAKELEEVDKAIREAWEQFEQHDQEYQDNVFRSLFKDTKHANEPIEKLKELLNEVARDAEPKMH